MSHKLETKAVRTQMERSQYLEHSTHCTSPPVLFLKMQKKCALHLPKKSNVTFTVVLLTLIPLNLSPKLPTWKVPKMGFLCDRMGAVFGTFAALLNSGDHIVSARSVFGSTHSMFTKFLPKWGIQTSYFDVAFPQQAKDLIQPHTKIIYAETPTNPGVDVLDLTYLGDLAQKHNLILVIDNCFATPYLQQPIKVWC